MSTINMQATSGIRTQLGEVYQNWRESLTPQEVKILDTPDKVLFNKVIPVYFREDIEYKPTLIRVIQPHDSHKELTLEIGGNEYILTPDAVSSLTELANRPKYIRTCIDYELGIHIDNIYLKTILHKCQFN